MQEVDRCFLFPVCVSMFNLTRKFTDIELNTFDDLLKSRRTTAGHDRSVSLCVLDEDNFINLKQEILEAFIHYMKDIMKSPKDVEIYITQSWLNISNKKGDYHHLHSHSNSFLSGVLYINTSNEDKIIFKKSEVHTTLLFPTTEFTPFNCDSWWLPSKTGQLLIFPSSLQHMIPPMETEHTRISLSMNTFLKGKIGQYEGANYLEL